MLASGDERGSGRLRRTPAAWPPFGLQLRRRCPGRAAKRRGLDAGRNPWVCAGVRAAEAERRRRAKPRVGLRGCRAAGLPERKAVCGHVVRYVLRARASSRSWATSKPGARLSRLPPRLLLTLPSCVRRGTHQYGQCREAPRGRRHPASSLQPSPRAPRPPNLPELRVLGHRLSFPMPLLAFARGRASYHLRSRVITGHTIPSPPTRVSQDPFRLTRGQNRPQHLETASFLPHFCPFKWKYGHHSSEGSRGKTLRVQSLVYLICNVSY